ncbi:MAG: hypothetical protein AB7O92_26735 [Acidimicrobiia bacterium]
MKVAAALIAVAAIEAWLPFRVELPWSVRHPPEVLAGGGVRFDGRSALVGDADNPPPWLAELDIEKPFRVHLRAATDHADQYGPVRLLSLSASVYSADVVVGQEGDRLVVRVRRSTSDWRGEPALDGGPVFADTAAHDIDLLIDGATVTLRVDGEIRAREQGDGPVMGRWERSHVLALGDEPAGDRAWQGTITEAVVQGDDLLRSDTLAPVQGRVADTRLRAFWRLFPADHVVINAARFTAFALLGLALPRRRWLVAAAAVFPLVLTVGKVFVDGRDPVLADALIGTVAVLAGVALQPHLPRWLPATAPFLQRLRR